MRGGGANNPFAAAIIKPMGINPPGTCVKLANGETANTPVVRSLISADGWVYPEPRAASASAASRRST